MSELERKTDDVGSDGRLGAYDLRWVKIQGALRGALIPLTQDILASYIELAYEGANG